MIQTLLISLFLFFININLFSNTLTFRQLACKSYLYKDEKLKKKSSQFLLRGEIVTVVKWFESSAMIQLKGKNQVYYLRKHHLSRLNEIPEQDKQGNYKIGKVKITKEKPISLFYKPNDLVEIDKKYKAPHVKEKSFKLRKEAYKAFKKMIEDADKEGLKIRILSAYRPPVYQEKLYRGSIEFQMLTKIAIAAKPGHSEHQLGTSADVMVPGKNIRLSKEFQWIKKNARKYGIYLTYPRNNNKGYQWEPWHLRYWGKTQFKNYYSD